MGGRSSLGPRDAPAVALPPPSSGPRRRAYCGIAANQPSYWQRTAPPARAPLPHDVASPSLVTGSADDSGHTRPASGALARVGGEQTDAATLIQDAQALLEAFAGRDAAALLSSVTELCRLLAARGATSRAELLLRQMLPIGDHHLDRDHVALGHVLHELAHLYLRDARYADAEPLLLRLYYMQCRRCGKDHPDAAAVLASLARVHQALGRHDEAESMWRQVIAVCERSLGPQHVATTTAVERLAESCAARGKVREAGQLRAQATTMREAAVVRSLAAPARAALVVLPSTTGALSVEEQPSVAAAPTATTQDALLAIHAELMATGAARDARARRRWPAVAAAAAAVILLLGGLTASGAASTFGARANDGMPAWEVWSSPQPLSASTDSTAPAATESALYEVRLAADVPAPAVRPALRPLIRARLIGPVPRLTLPEILSGRSLDDEVVVRFAVDAGGVPDTASVTVLRTPHELLTGVVRRAVALLRFEPARRGVPGAPGEPDAVEMSFRFSRAVP